MLKYGEAPYHECSSKGDKRFSAFYAKPNSLKGKSIEEAYQGMKVFEKADGTLVTHQDWRQAKGRKAVNQAECAEAYERWWREWVAQEGLLGVLKGCSGLSDIYGQLGHVCQAEVLWKIRNE